jgi:hypothetical protein
LLSYFPVIRPALILGFRVPKIFMIAVRIVFLLYCCYTSALLIRDDTQNDLFLPFFYPSGIFISVAPLLLLSHPFYLSVLPTVVAHVQFQVRSCGVYCGKSGIGGGVLQVFLFSPASSDSTNCFTLINNPSPYSLDADCIIK